MMLNPVLVSIPIFALLIAAETWYARRRDPSAFEAKDSWNNVFIGLASVAFGAFFGIFIGAVYAFAYSLAPFRFPADAWWTWAILFFVDDFAYYWFHRFSHESRLFWNFHVVHHSSQFYNLSVAVRQSWFSGLLHWIFYSPVMLLGFAPWMFATMHGFNLIYQFWIHTKFINSLGPLELVLNSPSHHRVHHGVNNPYLDKNYAGVLIVWDRLFGSFVRESEQARYGIIKPVDSYNPLWINTHAWVEMWRAVRKHESLRGKLRCIFASPNLDL